MLFGEDATVDGGEDEFAREQHVAGARVPDRGGCPCLDGPAQDEVQERVEGGAVEVGEIDALHTGSSPQRLESPGEGRVRSDRPDQEHQVGIDQLTEQRGRRRVEQVQIVDEQDERTVDRLIDQDGRTWATTATRSLRSAPRPAGSRWASAPSGMCPKPSVAVARAIIRPCASATARH